jgi:AIPR protein
MVALMPARRIPLHPLAEPTARCIDDATHRINLGPQGVFETGKEAGEVDGFGHGVSVVGSCGALRNHLAFLSSSTETDFLITLSPALELTLFSCYELTEHQQDHASQPRQSDLNQTEGYHMNPIVKAQLKEFSTRSSIENYDESTQFEVFTIDAVCNGALGEQFDPLDAHLKGTEFGLDGIAVVLNGILVTDVDTATDLITSANRLDCEFLFFQSKTSEKFDFGDISKCLTATSGFLVEKLNFHSEQISELSNIVQLAYENAEKFKSSPIVRIYYCTTGTAIPPDSPINALIDKTKLELDATALFSEVHIEMIGAKELQNMARIASADISSEFIFARNVVLPTVDQTSEAFSGYIPATELLKLCTLSDGDGGSQINKSVFYDNVRDFDEDSEINKSISISLQSDGGRYFVFRNNGVTTVARSLKRTGEKFIISDYQIVNGCQTSHILFNSREHIQDVMVPFRLIVSQDEEFISSVIIGTNNQNAVKGEQFWAFRPFLKGLEEYMRGINDDLSLYLERRSNQYRGQKIEKTRVISLQTLFKSMVSTFLFEPIKAGRSFAAARQQYGDSLFLEDHEVAAYHAASFLHYKLELMFRRRQLSRELKIFRTYIQAAVGLLHTEGRDIFNTNRRDSALISRNMVQFCQNESAFIDFALQTCRNIESIVIERRGVVSRDALRADEVLSDFKRSMLARPT